MITILKDRTGTTLTFSRVLLFVFLIAALAVPGWAADKTIAGLGTNAIDNPAQPTDASTGWSGSYVYYGKYEGNPMKYRVLTNSTTDFSTGNPKPKTMLLDCDTILKYVRFDENGTTKVWSNSSLKKWLNDDNNTANFLKNDDVFTLAER